MENAGRTESPRFEEEGWLQTFPKKKPGKSEILEIPSEQLPELELFQRR
jgi:hypothetical protein